MNEQGFDFGPKERRESKHFEPPPWERDQFEELARQQAEREAADAAAAATAEREAAARIAREAEQAAAAGREPTPDEAARETDDGEAEAPQAVADTGGAEGRRVAEMLAELAVEESPATRGVWKVSVAVGGVMVAFGAVFAFWGVAAMTAAKRTGAVGTFGGAVLLLFGAGFVAGGLYLVMKNLREQGVL